MTVRLIGTRGSVAEEFLDQPQLYDVFATQILDDCTSLQVVWSHWYGNGVSPGAGKNLTIDAELEHPAGVFTKIKFGGANTITTGPLTNVTCDPIAVTIASGTWVKIRGLYTGCCDLHRGPNATIGEGSVFPATGLNLTTARSASFNANFFYAPSAIIGATNKPSAIILGDSRPSGLGDVYTRADGSYGTAGGAMNAYPWAQMVQWGGKASDYLAGVSALQDELVGYATDVIAELGANDLWNGGSGGTTASAILTTHATLRTRYAAKRYHLCTVEPFTTSTDSWATLANQTVFYNNAQLQLLNSAVLANAMGYDPPLDFAAVVESSLGSGKWKVNGTANKYTIDGIHQSPYAYGLYPGAGFALAAPPLAPTGLALSLASASSVSVSWTDNATNETGYYVYYSASAVKPGTPQVTLTAGSTTTTVAGLSIGLTYTFWVEAYNAIGSSASITSSILISVPPSAPKFQMQGRNTVTQQLTTWLSDSPDWAGAFSPVPVTDVVLYARSRGR